MGDKVQQLLERLPGLEVDRSEARLAEFAIDSSGLEGERPLAILAPRNLEEVQKLMLAARDVRLALVPVSSKGEHHRGDTLCGPESAIVDLGHLDKVVRVDRRNRVCLFEAAVGFPALQSAALGGGLRALLPLAPRPGKSALASYLEREPTIYPRFQWDISDPLLCTEVVFGTGELFRTGAAAGPGTIEEQWAAGDAQKNPMGPGQSDLVRVIQGAQGTIGIVTWGTAKCERQPARESLHVLSSERLEPLVRVAYGLSRRNHADILFLVDGRALTALLARDRAQYLQGQARAAAWNLVYSLGDPLYYPEEKLAYVRREIRELAETHRVAEPSRLPIADLDLLHRRLTRPDLTQDWPHWRHGGLGAMRDLFFQTTLDRVERFLPIVDRAVTSAGWNPEDKLTYLQPQLGSRVCHVEFVFPVAAAARERRRLANDMVVDLAWRLKQAGAFFSRPYGPLTQVAFAQSSTASLVPRVKRLFDPDHILSPACLNVTAAGTVQGGAHAH